MGRGGDAMMRRKLLVIASALLAGSALLAVIDACTIVNGLTVPADAAVIDVAEAAADTGPFDPCDHARPPLEPLVPDLPGDHTIIVVARSFHLGGDGGVPYGF